MMKERRWDVDNLSLRVNPDLLSLIISIPLNFNLVDDTVGLGIMGLAKLQVSEIYRKLMGYMDDREDVSFQWIWRAQVSPRVKTFFWKLHKYKLPTRALLIQRGCSGTDECGWCTGQCETMEHLFCACSVSSIIWAWIGSVLGTKDSSSISELIAWWLMEGISKVFAQYVMMYAAWGVWKTRNASIFQGRDVVVKKVLFLAFQQAEERTAARPSIAQHAGSVNWNSPFCNVQRSKPIFTWEFPQQGWMKVHFDGAFDQNSTRGGGGFLTRDWLAVVKGARSLPRHGLSVPVFEFIGAYEGIKFAVEELRAAKLWVEGDSLSSAMAIWVFRSEPVGECDAC